MNQLRFLSNPRRLIQCLWIFIIFMIVACTQSPQTTIEPTKPITRTANLTITEENNLQVTLQPEIPQTQPTQTSRPASTTEPTVTTPTASSDDVTGQLFIFQPSGIYQISLPEEGIIPLFETEKGYENWGARFAQNKKFLAYWIKEENETELWFTPLSDWQPELLLTVGDLAYDFATPLWGVNDRYLFFMLSVTDDSGPFEDIKTVRTYIVDTETMDLVELPYWPGDCSILAPSPRSGQIALWCHQSDEQYQEYLVLEPEQTPWYTKENPNVLINDCNTYATCDWSQDGKFIAFTDHSSFPERLFYTPIENLNLFQLDDGIGDGDLYAFPLWSPNNQFLFFAGECVDGGLSNPTILNIINEKLVWCFVISSQGEYGQMWVTVVTWSPNSNFIAIPIMPDFEEEILIFDVLAQEEWGRISNLGGIILDMVWVDE